MLGVLAQIGHRHQVGVVEVGHESGFGEEGLAGVVVEVDRMREQLDRATPLKAARAAAKRHPHLRLAADGEPGLELVGSEELWY